MISLRTSPASDALKLAILQQVAVMILAAGIMDGGGIFLVAFFALFAYWGGVLLIRARRPHGFTKTDLFLFRWGYFLLCVVSFFLAQFIWKLRGYVA